MDYSATITTTAPLDRAAHAITHDLEQWWSTRIERTDTGFTTRFNNSHATFHFDPERSDTAFSWTCTDAHMIMDGVDDRAEWVGTTLLWQITGTDTGSQIQLTHRGLVPTLPCFDICMRGWQHFFETSLRDHLNGAQGAPNTT
ncbi:hypothetical protein [uncultured Tateyamaria sp.]|uniref:hypothetical protein n=1 Tax=uncultured Tateyamaria sp. TaxID=455651 RepID=UPI00261387E8|nr:hypothetical protein [uncultured Tateyamaria sp.]